MPDGQRAGTERQSSIRDVILQVPEAYIGLGDVEVVNVDSIGVEGISFSSLTGQDHRGPNQIGRTAYFSDLDAGSLLWMRDHGNLKLGRVKVNEAGLVTTEMGTYQCDLSSGSEYLV